MKENENITNETENSSISNKNHHYYLISISISILLISLFSSLILFQLDISFVLLDPRRNKYNLLAIIFYNQIKFFFLIANILFLVSIYIKKEKNILNLLAQNKFYYTYSLIQMLLGVNFLPISLMKNKIDKYFYLVCLAMAINIILIILISLLFSSIKRLRKMNVYQILSIFVYISFQLGYLTYITLMQINYILYYNNIKLHVNSNILQLFIGIYLLTYYQDIFYFIMLIYLQIIGILIYYVKNVSVYYVFSWRVLSNIYKYLRYKDCKYIIPYIVLIILIETILICFVTKKHKKLVIGENNDDELLELLNMQRYQFTNESEE